eukprot:1856551-Rhodomonas_salina.2
MATEREASMPFSISSIPHSQCASASAFVAAPPPLIQYRTSHSKCVAAYAPGQYRTSCSESVAAYVLGQYRTHAIVGCNVA